MKLLYLYIEKYKNLENVEIDFSKQDKNTTVFIGENGAGKSNLLEAIAKIFTSLYRYYITRDFKIDLIAHPSVNGPTLSDIRCLIMLGWWVIKIFGNFSFVKTT